MVVKVIKQIKFLIDRKFLLTGNDKLIKEGDVVKRTGAIVDVPVGMEGDYHILVARACLAWKATRIIGV